MEIFYLYSFTYKYILRKPPSLGCNLLSFTFHRRIIIEKNYVYLNNNLIRLLGKSFAF